MHHRDSAAVAIEHLYQRVRIPKTYEITFTVPVVCQGLHQPGSISLLHLAICAEESKEINVTDH